MSGFVLTDSSTATSASLRGWGWQFSRVLAVGGVILADCVSGKARSPEGENTGQNKDKVSDRPSL